MPNESSFTHHSSCPSCGSSDGMAMYSDGHGHCFVCKKYFNATCNAATPPTQRKPMAADLIPEGDFIPLPKRGLSEDTCRKWGYSVGVFRGSVVHIASYRDETGSIVAQKIRFPNKDFSILGDAKGMGLYGHHLWRDGGKRVIVTEGELDALSVSQSQGNKWPVCSIPNGANAAAKSIAASLEWLEKFESVIFLFDSDEHGIKAAKECALLLTPGKAYIGKLPLKDASDMLQAGRAEELIRACWDAKVYRPDGIVAGTELWDAVSAAEQTVDTPTPWLGLNKLTKGMRKREILTLCAGSGIGKSSFCREIAHSLITKEKETVGYVALEESTKRSAIGIMGIHLSRPLHISRDGVAPEDYRRAYDATVGSGRLFLYDHFGSIDSGNLLARLRYLARGCGCGWIILDHLSIVVSGIGDGDERRLIDNTMTQLRSLTEETGVGMILVSHLRRPEGKGHEEGAITSLGQLRGSAAIGQLSDTVVGLERNQQDEERKNTTDLRVLKCRHTGSTGVAGSIIYNPENGRLAEETVGNGVF